MKRIIFGFLFVISSALMIPTMPASAVSAVPEIIAESAILIDYATGDILYEKDKDALKEPASTTKIITCLLALERLALDKIVTIDAETPFTEGSRIYLLEGEEITVEQLLYALMLESANDAAVALAKEISGSVDEFAVLMNERARQLGAKNPSFKNPNGLHLDGHFISAYDLAMIAREAMKNEKFRELVSTYKYTIPATNKQPERNMYNTNRLIYDQVTKVPVKGVMTPAKYEGATGIKTGYTSHAGGCLASGAMRDGTELIAVVLKSTDTGRFGDSISLLDFGFENYYTHKAVDAGLEIDDLKVKMGAVNHVGAKVLEDKYITLPKEASSSLISTKIIMDKSVTAPVEKGQLLGKIEIYEGSDFIAEAPITAASAVAQGKFLSRFGVEDNVSTIINRILIVIASFALFLVLLYLFLSIRYQRRRKALRRKRALEIAMERERKQKELEQRQWPY